MKQRFLLAVLMISAVMIISSRNSFADYNPQLDNRWLGWSQSQKDNAIVNTALAQVGQWGGQCKTWVQMSVVKPASYGHVTLPLNNNAPYDYLWQYDSTYHAIGFSTYIEWVGYGDIIQMRLRGGIPHTMIVVWNYGTGMWVVDSNSQGNEMVRYYFLTFSQFKSNLENPWSFSVYYVQ